MASITVIIIIITYIYIYFYYYYFYILKHNPKCRMCDEYLYTLKKTKANMQKKTNCK